MGNDGKLWKVQADLAAGFPCRHDPCRVFGGSEFKSVQKRKQFANNKDRSLPEVQYIRPLDDGKATGIQILMVELSWAVKTSDAELVIGVFFNRPVTCFKLTRADWDAFERGRKRPTPSVGNRSSLCVSISSDDVPVDRPVIDNNVIDIADSSVHLSIQSIDGDDTK